MKQTQQQVTDIDLSYVITHATIKKMNSEICTVFIRGEDNKTMHNPRIDVNYVDKSDFEIKEEAYLIYMERINQD